MSRFQFIPEAGLFYVQAAGESRPFGRVWQVGRDWTYSYGGAFATKEEAAEALYEEILIERAEQEQERRDNAWGWFEDAARELRWDVQNG